MSLKAVRDMVIVKVVYAEKSKTIVIPDGVKQYRGEFRGKVISVGPECPHKLQKGDMVTFRRHEGFKIDSRGEQYLALRPKWLDAKEGR